MVGFILECSVLCTLREVLPCIHIEISKKKQRVLKNIKTTKPIIFAKLIAIICNCEVAWDRTSQKTETFHSIKSFLINGFKIVLTVSAWQQIIWMKNRKMHAAILIWLNSASLLSIYYVQQYGFVALWTIMFIFLTVNSTLKPQLSINNSEKFFILFWKVSSLPTHQLRSVHLLVLSCCTYVVALTPLQFKSWYGQPPVQRPGASCTISSCLDLFFLFSFLTCLDIKWG